MSKNSHTKRDVGNSEVYTGKDLTRNEIFAFADAFAISFEKYPLFEYFLNYKYSVSKMRTFWRVSLKTVLSSANFVSSGQNFDSVAVMLPNEKSQVSVWRYITSGGLGMIFKLGFPAVLRMLNFEKFAGEVKNKYATPNCWYLYAFVTMPELRGNGLGSKTLHAILDSLDASGRDCYLETLSPVNVEIYKKYGFELKEAVSIPNTDMTLFAMLRTQNKL